MIEYQLEITKTRGWAYCHSCQYPDWPLPVHTSRGARTLAIALWQAVGDMMDHDSVLTKITVKGRPMSKSEALAIIEKALSGGSMAYALPRYRAYLG